MAKKKLCALCESELKLAYNGHHTWNYCGKCGIDNPPIVFERTEKSKPIPVDERQTSFLDVVREAENVTKTYGKVAQLRLCR